MHQHQPTLLPLGLFQLGVLCELTRVLLSVAWGYPAIPYSLMNVTETAWDMVDSIGQMKATIVAILRASVIHQNTIRPLEYEHLTSIQGLTATFGLRLLEVGVTPVSVKHTFQQLVHVFGALADPQGIAISRLGIGHLLSQNRILPKVMPNLMESTNVEDRVLVVKFVIQQMVSFLQPVFAQNSDHFWPPAVRKWSKRDASVM